MCSKSSVRNTPGRAERLRLEEPRRPGSHVACENAAGEESSLGRPAMGHHPGVSARAFDSVPVPPKLAERALVRLTEPIGKQPMGHTADG